jgi:hypothetical protein
MEKMAAQSMSVQRLKVTILPLDLPCSGPITHSGDISVIGKSHKKKPNGKKLHSKKQKEPRKTTEDTSGCVRPEWVNKWSNSLIATL